MNEILTFTVISLLLVVSPGPNSVLILKTVNNKGGKAGIENILGLVLATFVHGAISILGLSALILQSAELFTLIKFIGAAYLLYLGLKTIWGTFSNNVYSNNANSDQNNKASRLHQNFIEGFLTQILNPKVSMFYLAAFPQFVDFGSSSYFGAFILVSIHASLIFFWFLGFSVFLVRVKRVTSNIVVGHWVQRFSGGLLVYFSALLLSQEARK